MPDTSQSISVKFTPNDIARSLKKNPRIADVMALLREAPVPKGEEPPSETELQQRAVAIVQALANAGVALARGGGPVLLLSAFRGGNTLQRMMGSLTAEIPTLTRTQLDRRVSVARDFLDAYRGRIV
jgi:hypothetical protein